MTFAPMLDVARDPRWGRIVEGPGEDSWVASQIAAGLDGIVTEADPGASADTPYSADAPLLPRTLMDAIAELRDSMCFRAAFGDAFVEHFVKLKEFEIGRFMSEVTDWEQREYFELL